MELSTDWISEFEIEDKDYRQFYKERVHAIRVYFLYINKEQDLFHIKKQKIKLSKSKLPKEELVQLLKKYRNYENKQYVPLSILKYNLTLQPQYIRDFIYDKYDKDFLTAENSIEEITYEKAAAIPPGSKVVSAIQEKNVGLILEEIAYKKNAKE